MQFSTFTGFTEELFLFLKDLKNNNDTEWFHKNRERYQKHLVEPARSFVNEISPFLNQLNPAIRTEPKFNKTLLRLNKDMRFVKGEPYRTYFLIHFGRFKRDSEFFIYFEEDEVQIGLYINNIDPDNIYFNKNITKYEKEIMQIFGDYKLNNRYDLYALAKEPEKIKPRFNAQKNFQKLLPIKNILFQKVNSPAKSKVFSVNFLIEAIKIFTQLYPLYAFSITPDPLKELDKFKENFF